MDVNIYYKAPKDLLGSVGFIDPCTGESVELSVVDKMIMIYMLDRTIFFTTGGGTHYESQATIGSAVNLEVKTVGRSLTKLLNHGFILGEKPKRGRPGRYTGVNIGIKLYAQTDEKIVVDKVLKAGNLAHIETEDADVIENMFK